MKRSYSLFEKYRIDRYVIYFMLGAIVGWVYEMIWCHMVKGEPWINRGFLFGPWLPIYGFGAVIMILSLRKLIGKKLMIWRVNIMPVLIFVIIFLITTVLEYFAHWLMKEKFGIILWDYSHEWMNINGRVCFEASRNFAIIGIVAIYGVIPLFDRKMDNLLSVRGRSRLMVGIVTVLAVDLLFTIFLR